MHYRCYVSGGQIQACGGPLNPWNYEATPLRKGIVSVAVGLAAIGAAAGFFALLAASGVDLHAFNALSTLTIEGGTALTVFSLAFVTLGIAWLATKSCRRKVPEPRERNNPREDSQGNGSNRSHPQIQAPTYQPQPIPLFRNPTSSSPSEVYHEPQIDTPPPLVTTPSVVREPNPFRDPPTREPEIEPYVPLELLKAKRIDLLSPLKAEVAAPVPETFPLLEGLKPKLAAPSVNYTENRLADTKKVQILRQRKNFLVQLTSYMNMLLQGHIDIGQTLTQDAIKLDGELTHPVQVHMVFKFARDQIEAFNKALAEHKVDDIKPIAIAEIEGAFETLNDEIKVWTVLLELDSVPIIRDDALEFLAGIKPPHHLKLQFEAVIRRLAVKPTDNPEAAGPIFLALAKKLNIDDLPTPASPAEPFVRKLKEDIQSLFQYESQEEDVEIPTLKLQHINSIREYIREEEERFFETYGIKIDVYSEFEDIEVLEEAWTRMDQLMNSKEGIDAKIELLVEIAHKIPEAEDKIWIKYHVIRDCMGLDLTRAFAFRFFSSYTFSHPLSMEDRERKIKIDGAFELLAKKLGCKKPEVPVIEMDTTSDSLIGKGEFKRICQETAQDIQKIYDELGAEMTAQTIIERTMAMGTSQKTYVQGILAELPSISDELTLYLTKILFG